MLTVALLLAAVLPRVGLSDAAHCTVEMTPIAAEGELAKELGRYGMTAWRTVNRGPKFSCLAYTPPNAGRMPIPLVVYIPGKGEIGPDLLKQFNQREATGSVYDILLGMRRCMINLPNRCYHLISRVAHRAFEGGKRRIERVAPL